MNDLVEQFNTLGQSASYHYADDSGKEYGLGVAKEREAMVLFHAHPELEDQFREKANGFLWSLDITLRNEAYRAARLAEKNNA